MIKTPIPIAGDRPIAYLTPDATLVVDAAGCVVLVTPERRITITNMADWQTALSEAAIAAVPEAADAAGPVSPLVPASQVFATWDDLEANADNEDPRRGPLGGLVAAFDAERARIEAQHMADIRQPKFLVTCPHGCPLGTSAQCATRWEAERRAEAHAAATRSLVPGVREAHQAAINPIPEGS
jgi:hypothetical protein